MMMPDTRGRTSAIRVGTIRPGNSRTCARARGCTTTTLTYGFGGLAGDGGDSRIRFVAAGEQRRGGGEHQQNGRRPHA